MQAAIPPGGVWAAVVLLGAVRTFERDATYTVRVGPGTLTVFVGPGTLTFFLTVCVTVGPGVVIVFVIVGVGSLEALPEQAVRPTKARIIVTAVMNRRISPEYHRKRTGSNPDVDIRCDVCYNM